MCKNLAMSVRVPRSGTAPHLVVVLALDTVIAFELGLAHRFLAASSLDPGWPGPRTGTPPPYDVRMVTLDDGPVMTSAGYAAQPAHPSSLLAEADTIVVPGINGPIVETGVLPEALRRLAATARPDARWVSICTGAFVLAGLGLLRGRVATTHWCHVDAFTRHFPDVPLNPDVLYVDHGDVLTSAGNAAGIDLLLHIVRSRPGRRGRQPSRPRRRRRALAGGWAGAVHRPPHPRGDRRGDRSGPHLGARAPRRADRPGATWPASAGCRCGPSRDDSARRRARPPAPGSPGLASTAPGICSSRPTCPWTGSQPSRASGPARRCASTSRPRSDSRRSPTAAPSASRPTPPDRRRVQSCRTVSPRAGASRQRCRTEFVTSPHHDGRRRELAARPVDVLPSRVPDRRRHPMGAQPLDEVLLDAGPARGPLRSGCRVQRDGVDVHPAPSAPVELLPQQVGPPTLVVDVPDQGVLDGHAPAGRLVVPVRRVDGLVDLPPRVDRHQLVTQLVVGGMERQGQRHRNALRGQLVDARDEPNGRHGDASGRHTEPVRRRVGQAADRADRRLVVGEGLAHPHEDDVAHSQRVLPVRVDAAGQLATPQRPSGPDDLLDDLGG